VVINWQQGSCAACTCRNPGATIGGSFFITFNIKSILSQYLHYIAILAPEPVASEVTLFKEDIALRYNSRAALKNMPHITLKAPFIIDAQHYLKLLHWFEDLRIETPKFTLQLNGFGSFPNPKKPVIFVKPEPSPNLHRLQKEIIGFYSADIFPALNSTDKQFHPHMTVAYRDLSFPDYEQAWAEYAAKQYNAAFEVNEVVLLQHNGRQWNPVCRCLLPG
jgi:2'-5' RNA ligase